MLRPIDRSTSAQSGYAIVPALVLVAILGFIATSVQYASPSVNRGALPANVAPVAIQPGVLVSTPAAAPAAPAAGAANKPADPSGGKAKGGDESDCTGKGKATEPGGTAKEVGMKCEPAATTDAAATPSPTTGKEGDAAVKGNCKPEEGVPAGTCYVKYCLPGSKTACKYISQGPGEGFEPPKNLKDWNESFKPYLIDASGGKSYNGDLLSTAELAKAESLNKTMEDAFGKSLDDQKGAVTNAEKALESARACDEASGGSPTADCHAGITLAREKLDAENKRLAELEKQNADLKADQVGMQSCGPGSDSATCIPTGGWVKAKDPESPGKGDEVPWCPSNGGNSSCYTQDPNQKKQLEAKGWTCAVNNTYDGSNCTPGGAKQPPCTGSLCGGGGNGGGGAGAGGGGAGADGGKAGGGKADGAGAGAGGGLGSALSSFLSGLTKGLTPTPTAPQQPAQACSTDPNIYAQQQQQYQSQLQQYNYQLQQYQYQQQLSQYNAQNYGQSPPPQAPQPAQPQSCTPSTGNQCQAQPQQPPSSACTAGSWQAAYSGSCITNWRCVPNNVSAPTATLSCEPKVADVGMNLAITYGCSSGVASSSSFVVTDQLAGSATAIVAAPPAGTNTATYTLACTDQGKTTGAQCSVQVARPNIILVANPKTVGTNGTSLLSWITTGMQSCIVSSPDQADFTARNSSNTSVSGTAETSAITSQARFLLHCETIGGGTKDATTTITVTR